MGDEGRKPHHIRLVFRLVLVLRSKDPHVMSLALQLLSERANRRCHPVLDRVKTLREQTYAQRLCPGQRRRWCGIPFRHRLEPLPTGRFDRQFLVKLKKRAPPATCLLAVRVCIDYVRFGFEETYNLGKWKII
jgi:hypothetical protein